MNYSIILLFMSALLVSCQTNRADNADLDKLKLKSGAVTGSTHQTSDLHFECSLMPLKEINGKSMELQVFYGIRHDQKIDLLRAGISSAEEFENKLKYCAFDIGNDFTIRNHLGADFPCLFSHYERAYGLDGQLVFQLVFQLPKTTEKLTLIYDDHLFGQGLIKHIIDTNELIAGSKIVI